MAQLDQIPPTDGELDLRSYLGVVRRRWRAIAIVIAVAVAAALALAIRQEPLYRASSELLIRQQTSESLLTDSGVASRDAERQLNNEVRLFESGAVRDAVASRYEGALDPADVTASVSSTSSDVVRVSLVATDGDEAAALVNLYVDTYLEWRRQQRVDELLAVGEGIRAKVTELDARIAELRAPLVDLEARLAEDPSDAGLQAQIDELERQLSGPTAELESQRAFYMGQIEELDLTADIAQTGGAKVLTKAEAPDSPVSPRPARDAVVALMLGLMLGLALAFLLESLDERIRSVADLERVAADLPTLAAIPQVEKGHSDSFVATRDDAKSGQAEAYRLLRTAVKFAGLERDLKVLQVTSAGQGEGKTTAIANLAVALAQGGDRVAVVCCDLRRPRVQDRFGVDLTPGFTDVILGDAALADALRRYDANILILPAGSPPPNPSELLSSGRAVAVIRALAEEFDVVLIDSTPVLPVTDALVVSRYVDATIIVVDSRSTSRKAATRTLQLLRQVNAPTLGLVLNGLTSDGYGYGYGYGQDYDSNDPIGKPKSRQRR